MYKTSLTDSIPFILAVCILIIALLVYVNPKKIVNNVQNKLIRKYKTI